VQSGLSLLQRASVTVSKQRYIMMSRKDTLEMLVRVHLDSD